MVKSPPFPCSSFLCSLKETHNSADCGTSRNNLEKIKKAEKPCSEKVKKIILARIQFALSIMNIYVYGLLEEMQQCKSFIERDVKKKIKFLVPSKVMIIFVACLHFQIQ